jgi:hypothetical protein
MHSIALLNGDLSILRNNQPLPGAIVIDEGVMRRDNNRAVEQFGNTDSHTIVAAINTACQPSAGYAPVTEVFENSERVSVLPRLFFNLSCSTHVKYFF